MSGMPVVVIDPGHGGPEGSRNGGSSWNRSRGPNGLLEKNVAFDLALRVAARVGGLARVEITRSEADNPTLAERAELARRNDAAVFLSLHLNGSNNPDDDGTDVYVAPDAHGRTRAFGESVWRRLSQVTGSTRGGLAARDFGNLLSVRHSPRTVACLAEVAYLTNARQARAFEEEAYRNRIADALGDAIREQLGTAGAAALGEGVTESLAIGDGSPFAARAAAACYTQCTTLRGNAANAASPNVIAAQRIRRETGIAVDANPYFGITASEIEAVVRAAFQTACMPEVLLALWAKEGSTRSVSAATAIAGATSDANARSLFRSRVFYQDLGLDHFIVTRYDATAGDNVFDDRDSAAATHETHFTQRVRALVTSRHLSQDIAGAINSELTVTTSGGVRSITPSIRFYSLCLMLADAFWSKLQANTFPLLGSVTDGLNYIQWNVRNFNDFLRSAETHRVEPRHQVNGRSPSIHEWALQTVPRTGEWVQPRTNAVKFLHYIESYRPIFRDALNLIKPGIEDLQTPRGDTRIASVLEEPVSESLGTVFPSVNLFTPAIETVPFDVLVDDLTGAPHAMTHTVRTLTTRAQLLAELPVSAFQESAPGSNSFAEMPMASVLPLLPFFDVTDPARVKIKLESVMCYPADPADANRLAGPGTRKFPVVIIVHGNHDAADFTFTATGAPVAAGGGATVFPANPTAATQVRNHAGYSNDAAGPSTQYLQEELARHGFVSMSINQNVANFMNLDFSTRGEMIMVYLDQLRRIGSATTGPNARFRDRLDFAKVGLIGHSRGGDAVVEAVRRNLARPANRFGIKSVVSLAPTDITGEMRATATGFPLRIITGHNAFYCVVYGSHDGDVRGDGNGTHGGTGFSYYDRSTTHRSMVFIHGATHNRFNRVWNDLPNDGDPSHVAADTSDARMLTRAQHETLAKEYIAGWLRYTINLDYPQQQLFNGANANSLSKDVSLQWKFGRDLRGVENCEDATPGRNTLSGVVTPSSAAHIVEVETHDQNDLEPAWAAFPGLGAIRRPTFPNDDKVLRANNVAGGRARVLEEVPAAHGDVSTFTHLTFRVTKKYPIDSATFGTEPFPDFEVTLIDAAGARRTVNNAAILTQNPRKTRPYQRRGQQTIRDAGGVSRPATRNFTKCNMETWSVPLTQFSGVSLTTIRGVEFSFNAAAGQPVYVDTISFVRL